MKFRGKFRWLIAGVLLLVGCAASNRDSANAPEFFLFDVPSDDSATGRGSHQGMNVLAVVGHGRVCYVASFGASKVLLFCEPVQKSVGP